VKHTCYLAVSVLLVLALSPAWANQPVNPSFELGNAGEVPEGWTVWSGGDPILKVDLTPQSPDPGGVDTSTQPFEYDFPDDGNFWAGAWYPEGSAGDIACIYQIVPVNPSSTGGISVRASLWDERDGYNSQIWVGVDPAGGVDPYDTGIYWVEKWETQWPPVNCDPPQSQYSQGDHVWLDFTVPRIDGTNCGQGSAVGALAAWGGYNSDTNPIAAVGSRITIFLLVQHKFSDGQSVFRFDSVATTGDWAADNPSIGQPPEVSGLTTPADGVIRDVSVEYVLTDPEDADADATLAPKYRVGSEFDDSQLLELEVSPINGMYDYQLSSDSGNGTGIGNVRIVDHSDGDIIGTGGSTAITAPVLVYSLIGDVSVPYLITAKITDLDLGTEGWAGAGIVVLRKTNPTAVGAPYFAVAVRRDGTNDSLRAEFKSSTPGDSFSNPTELWADLPQDGSGAIYLRARRAVNGQWKGEYSTDGSVWRSAGLIDPADLSGTDIDYGEELTVGFYVQHNCAANFDFVTSGFVPAANKAGMGDGTTNLPSDSTGVPHVFYWDAPGDLGVNAFASRVELQLTASDDDGTGDPAATNVFRFELPALTGVDGWQDLR